MPAPTSTLAEALNGPAPLVAPLTLDPLMGRIAEHAGFRFGYLSGGALGYAYAVSEALLTLTEIADATRRVVQRCGLGIIADVGVGFGDPVHAARTVWELEAAGAAAIEIEDQVAPKRVSHHRGIEHLVDTAEMVQKISQCVAARRNSSMLIIARTGAVHNESFAAALDRLAAYREAGADVLMLMPESDEHVRTARDRLSAPLATIAAMDQVRAPRWRDSGWNLIIDPFTAQVLAVQAVRVAYQAFAAGGESGVDLKALFAAYRELPELAGLNALYEIEDASTERGSQ